MSKRGQEGPSSDCSPMAKPKLTSLIKAKARPMNLVLHSSNVQLSARSSSAQDLSNPGNHGKRRQAWKQENAQNTEAWEQDIRARPQALQVSGE